MLEDRAKTSEFYSLTDGEPSAVNRSVWNGDLADHVQGLLNQIHREKDFKKRERLLVEVVKATLHFKNELAKATFYKDEWESVAKYMDSIGVLHSQEIREDFLDDRGKTHSHVIQTKRSVTKSIPSLRAVVQVQ